MSNSSMLSMLYQSQRLFLYRPNESIKVIFDIISSIRGFICSRFKIKNTKSCTKFPFKNCKLLIPQQNKNKVTKSFLDIINTLNIPNWPKNSKSFYVYRALDKIDSNTLNIGDTLLSPCIVSTTYNKYFAFDWVSSNNSQNPVILKIKVPAKYKLFMLSFPTYKIMNDIYNTYTHRKKLQKDIKKFKLMFEINHNKTIEKNELLNTKMKKEQHEITLYPSKFTITRKSTIDLKNHQSEINSYYKTKYIPPSINRKMKKRLNKNTTKLHMLHVDASELTFNDIRSATREINNKNDMFISSFGKVNFLKSNNTYEYINMINNI